ncbi:MAG: hypothetical protein ACI9VN_000923, partial [Patescibacteria group bacterium]
LLSCYQKVTCKETLYDLEGVVGSNQKIYSQLVEECASYNR